jgi:hypothetical protein
MILKYPEFIWEHYNIYSRLGDLPFDELTCIDFGCGDYRSDVAKQVLLIPFKELTSVEGYAVDYTEMLRKKFEAKKHNKILAFIPDYLPTIMDKKFDIAFAFDVIEHLDRGVAIKLMKWVKLNCKYALFYVPEEPVGFHRVWEDGNALQEHISHWKQEDFEELGFKVERDINAHSDQVDGKEFHFDALWISL